MQSYLAETYVPRPHAAELGARDRRARAAARELAADGTAIRFVRSIFVPQDEICLLVFEAASAEAVVIACERAALRFERIVEAIESEKGKR